MDLKNKVLFLVFSFILFFFQTEIFEKSHRKTWTINNFHILIQEMSDRTDLIGY